MSVDSRLTAFLLLVSGNLIRLEAISGAVAPAVVVSAAISTSAVAARRQPPVRKPDADMHMHSA
jgi:hypothetical protein